MPSPFKKLNRQTAGFFKKIDRGANHFFKKDIPHAANVVGGQIELGAKKTKQGLERVGKELQKNSGYITDALAVGGVLAAPFSGGASLALEGAAAGNQAANDFAKKAKRVSDRTQQLVNSRINAGQQKLNDVVSNINRQAQSGLAVTKKIANKNIQKAAVVAQNNLRSLADSIPVQNTQRGAMPMTDDGSDMVIH